MIDEKSGARHRLPLVLTIVATSLVVLAVAAFYGMQAALRSDATPFAADRVEDFALLDHEGKYHQLSRYARSRAIVLFVHGVGCNISRDSIQTLKQLRDRYGGRRFSFLAGLQELFPDRKGSVMTLLRRAAKRVDDFLVDLRNPSAPNIAFLMINANPQDDRQALSRDAHALGIDLPILKDDTQLVAEGLRIDRTGEALLIDARTRQIVYRGPVDDRLSFEGGKQRASHHYLHDAIEALLDGRAGSTMTPAFDVGCRVSLNKGQEASYARQVAPLLIEKCLACHQAGGIGPWAMDSYEKVRGWSAMMREVLKNRRMPPWHADPSVGSFSNDRSLNTEQIRTLVHWIEAGAPRGGGPDPLLLHRPQRASEWPLGKPDLVIDVPEQAIPASGVIDYRYVDVPLPFDRDVWVRAVHLKPSNRTVAHHAFAFVNFPPQSPVPQPEWREGLDSFFAIYVPGVEVAPFPVNSGQMLPRGSALQFQLHYTTVGYATTDRPRFAIYLHQRPPQREFIVAGAWRGDMRIPRYAVEHPVEARFVFDRDVLLHGLMPHMHLRGSHARYEARYPGGTSETLLSVPRYQFKWQNTYALRVPKAVPAGTEIRFKGAFDNSELNPVNPDPAKEVFFGKQSWDEMFIGYVFYTVPRRPAAQ